jgi:hypothetical protein
MQHIKMKSRDQLIFYMACMPKRLQILNENDCCIIFNTTKHRTDKERTVFIRDDINVIIIDKRKTFLNGFTY